MEKNAKADVKPVRQRTQYTCVATSVTMALNALGKDLTEDQVNRILGAEPKKGARWEEAIATLQYFGCRGTLTAPSTLAQIKEWTDSWRPVLISWNPEGRPWSHASCVFHVEQGPPEIWAEDVGDDALIQGSGPGLYVWIADPNIPNPNKTYRIIHENEFYAKWGEDWGDFIVRRPALMVDLEITPEGRQVMASNKSGNRKRKWERLSGGGQKFMSDEIMCWVTPEDTWETVRDRNIPELEELLENAEPSAYADESGEVYWEVEDTAGNHAKWVRQGWWPKPVKVQKWKIRIMTLRPTVKNFESGHFKSEREALKMAEKAIPIIEASKTPRWMKRIAGRKGKRPQQNVPKRDKNKPMRIEIDPTRSPGKDPFSNTEKHRRNDGAHKSKKDYRRRPKHPKPYGREAESDSTIGTAELQSSFYKTLEGEMVQMTPLRMQPDYGEKTMDINEMLEQLKQEEENSLTASAMEETLKTANTRPAGGLYGYTKSTQRDVLASVRKVQKSANRIAKTIYAKDKNTFNFLHLHAERSNSLSARILCAAMENIGPKTASKRPGPMVEIKGKRGLWKVTRFQPQKKGDEIGWGEIAKVNKQGEAQGRGYPVRFRGIDGISVDWKRRGKYLSSNYTSRTASTKTAAGHGMYGYRVKTAKLALQACLDISQEAGSVAYDLHTRRTAKYAKITSFLKDHSKRGRCRYARLLLRLYPEMSTITASDEDEKKADEDEKEAKHEKGKSVPLSKMPPELQEQAKNPANHFKKKKAKLTPALEQMLSGMDERNLKEITRWKANDKMTKDLIEGAKAELKRQKSATDILIAQAEEILKNADGCDKLPPALQENCKNPSFGKGKGKDKKDDDKDESKDDGKKDDGKMPADVLEGFKKKKADGCDKLPPALKENCESGPPNAKKKDSDSKEAESDDEKDAGLKKLLGNPISDAIKDGLNPKKASRTRLTSRIANGELQRGEVRFASEDQEDEDQKDAGYEGRSQLPGEEESNEKQPRTDSGYNPGGTEFNGDQGKAAADESELKEKAEGRTYLPGDEEADEIQPDMNQHGYDAGAVAKLSADYETVTGVTNLPDGAKLYWVE